jgi:hypothetical protein
MVSTLQSNYPLSVYRHKQMDVLKGAARTAAPGVVPLEWVGVPFGAYARLILLYLQMRALRTGNREVELGRSRAIG